MQDSPSDHFPVTAVLLRQASQNRWLDASWSLLGTLPGIDEQVLNEAAGRGELVYLTDMSLQLHQRHCDAYYLNLLSEQPKVYLVCSEEDNALAPLLLTVDFDEAASYMETGVMVLEAPLADALCVWLERYVVAHYQPAEPKKRKRRRWHDADNGHAA